MQNLNWKNLGAAIFSLLSMIAVIPYSLGDLGTLIPPEWKSKVLVASLIAAFLLRAWNAIQPQPTPPPKP